jgi:hypothetical protein
MLPKTAGDCGVSEDDLARVLYEAEFDADSYPWEKQSSAEQLTYKTQAEAVLRKFSVRLAATPSPWRDIGSAPASTSIIVVTDDDIVGEAHFDKDDGNWYWASGDPSDYHDTQCRYPRLWQPLPAPPASPLSSTDRGSAA